MKITAIKARANLNEMNLQNMIGQVAIHRAGDRILPTNCI